MGGSGNGSRFHASPPAGSQGKMSDHEEEEPMATDRSYVTLNQAQLARLEELVKQLGDRELSRPLEAGWTVASVLAHLAFWDYRIVTLLEAWGADGRGTPPPAISETSVDWINDAGKPLCLSLPPRGAARLAVEAAAAAGGALRRAADGGGSLPGPPAELSRHGPVTIRHLLSMTSGLRDVLEVERLRGVWHSSPSDRDTLLALAGRQIAVSAPPGLQYMYANVNALLLDELIARVCGVPAESFRRGALYEPLGLARTGARPHDGIALSDLAEPYVADGAGGWSRARDLLGLAADPLTTTLDDLTRWLLALRSGAIGGVEVTARMAERTRVGDGTRLHYGLGLAVRRYRGLTVLRHTGSQPGYKAHIAYVPERDLGVVILSNREDTPPARLAAAIMDEVIGDRFPAPHPADHTDRRLREAGLTTPPVAAGPR